MCVTLGGARTNLEIAHKVFEQNQVDRIWHLACRCTLRHLLKRDLLVVVVCTEAKLGDKGVLIVILHRHQLYETGSGGTVRAGKHRPS